MSNKRYIGNGKINAQYGIINFSVCLSDLEPEDIFEYNGKKYVKLSVGEKKTESYGKTHSVWVDDFKPEGEGGQPAAPAPQGRPRSLEDQDLPF